MPESSDKSDPRRLKPVSSEVPRELTRAMASTGKSYQLLRELGKELEPALAAPRAVSALADGRIFTLDRPTTSAFRITTFAPGNVAPVTIQITRGSGDEHLLDPAGLCLDKSGIFYISDIASHAVKKFSADGRWLATFATAGLDGSRFDGPRDLVLDDAGNLIIADTNNNRIVQLTPNGELSWVLERFTAGGNEDEFYEPWSVCLIGSLLWVADTNNNRVLVFDAQRNLRGALARGEPFVYPSGIRPSRDGKTVHVADHGNLRVRRCELKGSGVSTLALTARLDSSNTVAGGSALAIDGKGQVVLVHPLQGTVVVLDYPGVP